MVAASAIVVLVGVGLLVHTRLADTAITDIAGDALYAAAAYCAVVLISPRVRPRDVGAIAATWCVAVELFQLTGLPVRWAAVFPPVMLALGTVFDPRDLVVYLVTIAAVALGDAVIAWRRRARQSGSRASLD